QLGGVAMSENGKRYDAALYPVPPWQPQEGFKVDRALIYALARRESFFNPEAVSGRGACGLMQLMPNTANLVAHQKVDNGDCSGRLLDPSYNMALGQTYVRRLASEPMIGTNLLFLLTAYNSGPGKLAHWKADGKLGDPLVFIESLPVHETRNYVQQVMMHYWTYRARLAEPVTSMAQLAKGEWPRYALRDETFVARAKTGRAEAFAVASSRK
nr:lytic transglycosylase domain-containing protein [Pseudomonadota bacterium]